MYGSGNVTDSAIDLAHRVFWSRCPPTERVEYEPDTSPFMTHEEIAAEIGVTHQAVQLILKRAMKKIIRTATHRLGRRPQDMDDLISAYLIQPPPSLSATQPRQPTQSQTGRQPQERQRREH